MRIAPRRAAQCAQRFFGKVIAKIAVPHAFKRRTHGYGQTFRTRAIPLQQVKGHTLCGARTDAGQAAQRVDQGLQG
jgi:hypothetical protein